VKLNNLKMKTALLTLLSIICVGSIVWSQTTFLPKVTINPMTGDAPFAIQSGTIDGDALPDILIASQIGNTIEWYKNNGDGSFTIQPLVANTLSSIGGLTLVDLNNDTFLDILATGYSNDNVSWFPNDGLGNFITQNVISSSVDGASGIAVVDINNDTFVDIAITAYDGDEVVWFSNNGTGIFTLETAKIDDTLDSPGSINMKDIDGDGDLDALVSTAVFPGGNNVIEIFRNNLVPSGTVSFTKDVTSVTTDKIYFFNATFEDLDGDANLDILATDLALSNDSGSFYWYEDNGSGFTENEISTSIGNPSVAQFRDLDDDGLNDIILSSGRINTGNDIVWFKNNGSGGFDSELVIDATQSQAYVFTVNDFDNDGDLDIASCAYNSDALNYFENERYILSVSNFEQENVKIYPNPAKDILNFEGFNSASIEISIFDILGKSVLNRSLNTNETLDVSQLVNGIYTITINGTFASKFIKE
jgi:hypothetical protein